MKRIAFIDALLDARINREILFADISGQPMLAHVARRVASSSLLDEVIVSTSIRPSHQPVVNFCEEYGLSVFRGSDGDALDRLYQAASSYEADIIVHIPSTSPLIDPFWIDAAIGRISLASGRIDYVSNFFPERKLPAGLEVEAVTLQALRKVWANFTETRYRERPFRAIHENPHQFYTSSVHHCDDLTHLDWQADSNEGIRRVRKIVSALPQETFSWTATLQNSDAA